MVTFATSTPEVQRTGIGSQQIVQGSTTSFAGIAQAAGSALVQGADLVGTEIAKSKAKDIVSAAQRGVDHDVASIEDPDIGSDPVLSSVAATARKAAAGIAGGKISRENARLLVGNSVTKAIEEQPFLTRKIREAAGNLLGFNPESVAVQQFFSAFDTDAQLSSAGAGGAKRSQMNPFVRDANDLVAAGIMSQPQADLFVAQKARLDITNDIALAQLAAGNNTAEQAFKTLNLSDTIDGQSQLFGAMNRLSKDGKEVSAIDWRQQIDVVRSGSWAGILTKLNATGNGPDTATIGRMRQEHAAKYETLFEQVKDFDSNAVRKENIDRIVSMNQIWAAETLPVMKALTDGFGDQTGGAIMDLYKSAQGDPNRLKALLTTAPHLKPLIDELTNNPSVGVKRVNSSLAKLFNPGAVLTAEDGDAIDLVLSQVGVKAPPEEREGIIEALFNKKLDNKAASLLATAGRGGATSKEVNRMKNQWNTAQAVLPSSISEVLSDNDASLSVNDDGQIVLNTGSTFIGRGGREADRPARTNEASTDVNSLNIFLRAANRGWGQDLKISDSKATAKQLVDSINTAAQEIRDTTEVVETRSGRSVIRKKVRSDETPTTVAVGTTAFNAQEAVNNLTPEQRQALLDKAARIRGR